MDNKSVRKCPQCLAEVPAEAKKCSHCGSKLPQKTSMLVKVLLGIIGGSFLISIVSGLTMAPSSGVPAAPKPPTAYEKELSAEVYAETYIERLLKAPSTADFCSMNTTDLGDNRWRITSCVDSQNSYGAMIRSNWETTMIYTEDPAGWEMEKVIFDGKVIYQKK
jgi:hypothetical protein